MRLTNLGQCCFLIEVAGKKIVTDPYLSFFIDRVSGPNHPVWTRSYAPPCTLKELDPDLVVISHSHGDHMDPDTLGAYREAGGDCPIAAPAPECKLLEKLGFTNIIYARAEQGFDLGDVRVTPIVCAHTQPHTDDQGRFRELSYLIEGEGKRVLFGGDLSLYDGLKERVGKADAALIPANGRDEERTKSGIIGNTDAREAAELCKAWDALFIPTHYDLYPKNGCPIEEITKVAEEVGVRFAAPALGAAIGL